MPPNYGVRQRSSLNDIKSFRAQYRQALPSLTELFPDWSHNDLLFVMDECQGDLDLAITRISEGHANQWGQVKSKKPKPKPATAQLNHKKPNQKLPSTTTTATSPSTADASADGKARGKNGKHKSNGKHHKPKRNSSRKDKIDKGVVEKAEEEEEKKPSWASIAKRPTKPEVVVQPTEDTPSEAPPILTGQEEKAVETDNVVVEPLVDHIQEQVAEQVLDQITEEAIEQAVDQLSTDEPETAVVVTEEEPSVEPVVIAEPLVASNIITTTTVRKPTIRRLNQTEPVVLPNNQQADLPSVSVQFGSLNLTNGEEMTRDENEEAVEETAIIENVVKQASQSPEEAKVDVVAPSASPAAPEQAKPKETPIVTAAATPTTSSAVSNGLASFHNTNKPLPEPFHPQQQQRQPARIQPQQQQQQQLPIQPQPIQPHMYSEPYSMNPYATYVANMHNPVGGYTGGIPTDYYSADPQRMAYYDTSVYGQSPLMNGSANGHLFTRDRYSTPAPHPPMEMMNQTPPPLPSAQQYPHPHAHPAQQYPPPHAPPPPPPPPPQAPASHVQNYGYYPLSYQQQQQQNPPPPQQPYVDKSMYNAAIPTNKYDYSAYEDYYQQQQQQQQQQPNHEIMYTSNIHPAPSAPPAHPHLYQSQQPQPSRQPYWH